jgi:hypothetical protein
MVTTNQQVACSSRYQLLLKAMLGGNVGVEGNNMLLVDLAILFRLFGFLAP